MKLAQPMLNSNSYSQNTCISWLFNLLVFAFIILFTQACAVGPNYERPETAASEQQSFINDFYEDKEAKAEGINHWWERIDDRLLNQYVDQLLEQNLELIQAAERVVQARASVTTNTAEFYPSLSANASGSRSFARSTTTGERVYTNSYNADLSSTWEIDLFGKIHRSVEAADARYLASVYDREALAQSLIADLVALRVEIAVNKRLLDLAKKTVKNRKNLYEFVKNQYELGVQGAGAENLLRAEDSYTSVLSDKHLYERLLADALYRLDVLLGQAPGTTDPLKTKFSMLLPKHNLPVCLPVHLLDRRPDLRTSELRLKAANADIGVAIGDLYPSLGLTGSYGYSGTSTNNLISSDQLAGALLGSLTTRLFEGGALRANIDIQESEARELSAAYAAAVLNAMREVESNLKSEQEILGELKNDRRSVEVLKKAQSIINDRYRRGLERFDTLLDSERDLYAAEQNLLNTQREQWNTRISLYLALGGDWFSDQDNGKNYSCEG